MCHKKIAILSKGMNEFIRMVLDKGYYFLDVVGVYHFWQKKGKLMENNIIFQKLTPTDTVRMEVYEDAFKYIFENADIKNVAVAGPYSAGKSSLLESYKKKYGNKKFLHISLAHFGETTDRKSVV